MISSNFSFQINNLYRVDSTNSYARQILRQKGLNEGQVFWTDTQERGQGQRGTIWESQAGKNLLFSLVITPDWPVQDQFQISQCIALALKRTLDSLSVDQVSIKWPNDLLVGRKKIAGVLIENSLEGDRIRHAIIGIGINVNQTDFSNFNRAACSLAQLSGKTHQLEAILNLCLREIKTIFEEVRVGRISAVLNSYLDALWAYKEPVLLRDAEGEFRAKIEQVLPDGRIMIRRQEQLKTYDLKGLEFID